MGGQKARGNPLGASGVYQVVEAALQLRGRPARTRSPGARRALVQSLGGPAATAVTHVLERWESRLPLGKHRTTEKISYLEAMMEIPRHWRLKKQRYGLVGEDLPALLRQDLPPAGCLPGMRRRSQRALRLQREGHGLFLYRPARRPGRV